MGGGASKSNRNNAHSEESSAVAARRENPQQSQQYQAQLGRRMDAGDAQQQDCSPRAPARALFGNNHEDDDVEEHDEDEDDVSYSEDGFDPNHLHRHGEGGEEEDTEEAQQLRMLFAQSAMSMDMDNEDLIFNLMYFGGDTSNFASMMNNAAEETVAAHSAGNTPYKLTPATDLAIQKLKIMTVTKRLITDLNLQECSICQEELEIGNVIAEMPGCSHCFHNECVLKWFNLQSWCPVCRTKILSDGDHEHDHNDTFDEECNHEAATTKGNAPTNFTRSSSEDMALAGVKSNLGDLFDEAADERGEEVQVH